MTAVNQQPRDDYIFLRSIGVCDLWPSHRLVAIVELVEFEQFIGFSPLYRMKITFPTQCNNNNAYDDSNEK